MATPLRSKKRGNAVIWALMALLMLGLGGFGATNFGGSVQSIGTVGDREIDLRDYARALRREMQAVSAQTGQPLTFTQAQALGIDQSVLAQSVSVAALASETDRIGLSVGDAEVRRQLMAVDAFEGLDGKFNRETYALVLQREGMSEADFEAKLRDDGARTLLQGAIVTGAIAPDALVQKTTAWANESRDFSVAELIPSDLPEPVPEPGEDEIKAYYDANPATFTSLETRKISYVWLSPEMIADTIDLDDTALRAAYEERLSEFVTPERRLVERLVFPNDDEAAAAKARLDAGEITLEDLAAERGLALTDLDMGEMTKEELGAAGEAIFALTDPGIVGPLPSDLGPALFAMNGILEPQEITFEDAREDLAVEARADRARRAIAEQNDALEDLLASGATLEEVAKETPGMDLGTIDFTATEQDGIAAYSAFRDAAAAATENDFPTLTALDDGGVFALRLDAIEPPALRPLDEVRDDVVAGWTRDETHKRLLALGEEIKAKVEGGTPIESLGLVVTRYADFTRGGFIADTPQEVGEAVFTLPEGGVAVVDAADRVHVIGLTAINAADPTDEDFVKMREALETQIGQSLAQDMFQMFTRSVENRAGIHLDAAAISAVQAQMN